MLGGDMMTKAKYSAPEIEITKFDLGVRVMAGEDGNETVIPVDPTSEKETTVGDIFDIK